MDVKISPISLIFILLSLPMQQSTDKSMDKESQLIKYERQICMGIYRSDASILTYLENA